MCRINSTLLIAAACSFVHLSAAAQPTLVGEGIISTDQIEYGPAFSPEGTTLYFTRRSSFREAPQIYYATFDGESWSSPVKVSFAHDAGDELPSVSSDGDRLYFSSARPAPGREDNGRNDMWMVTRTDTGWSEPVHLGGELSTDDIDSHPVEIASGLYFHSRRTDADGSVNAYFAPGAVGEWSSPQLLPFNSSETDGEVAPAPDGSGVVFYSEREGGFGRGDLYYVSKNANSWGEAMNLGQVINSDAWEWSPGFVPGSSQLIFARLDASGADSDLYVVDFTVPE